MFWLSWKLLLTLISTMLYMHLWMTTRTHFDRLFQQYHESICEILPRKQYRIQKISIFRNVVMVKLHKQIRHELVIEYNLLHFNSIYLNQTITDRTNIVQTELNKDKLYFWCDRSQSVLYVGQGKSDTPCTDCVSIQPNQTLSIGDNVLLLMHTTQAIFAYLNNTMEITNSTQKVPYYDNITYKQFFGCNNIRLKRSNSARNSTTGYNENSFSVGEFK